jgi:hypothetical protein
MLAALFHNSARVLTPVLGYDLSEIIGIDFVAGKRLSIHRKVEATSARDGHRFGTFLGTLSGVTFFLASVATTFQFFSASVGASGDGIGTGLPRIPF